VAVKDGIVVWETQQLDYPLLMINFSYDPRRVQRGSPFLGYILGPFEKKIPQKFGGGLWLEGPILEKEKKGHKKGGGKGP